MIPGAESRMVPSKSKRTEDHVRVTTEFITWQA
jgi:hypothetical protein